MDLNPSTLAGAFTGFVTAVFGAGVVAQKGRALAAEVVDIRADHEALKEDVGTIPERLSRIEGQLSMLVERFK